MAKRTLSQTDLGRSLFEKYSISDLQMFRAVLQELLDTKEISISNAVQNVSGRLSTSFRTNKQKEADIRSLLETYAGVTYLTKIGGNKHQLTEKYRGVVIELLKTLNVLDECIGSLCGTQKAAKGSVSIGTIVSVVSYLGPAFLSLVSRVANKVGINPHVDFFHADFDINLQRLSRNEIDLILDQDTEAPLPPEIDKLRIPMQGEDVGVIFRLGHPSHNRTRLFPKLFKAVANGDCSELRSEFSSVPLLLTNPSPTSRPDPLLIAINKALFRINDRVRKAPVATLPTTRIIRHFVRMGLGAGIGHAPRRVSKRRIKLSNASKSQGVVVGSDIDAPDVDIVYVPLSMLKLTTLLPPPSRFALYFRRISTNVQRQTKSNADLRPVAQLAMNCLLAIVTNKLGDFGYLRFQDNKIAHDFHFGDDPHIVVPEDKIDAMLKELQDRAYLPCSIADLSS